jgi:hypothetical protein
MRYTAPDSGVSVCVARKFRSNCIPPKHDSYVPHYSEKIGHIQEGWARNDAYYFSLSKELQKRRTIGKSNSPLPYYIF